jgi:hypothetical protein
LPGETSKEDDISVRNGYVIFEINDDGYIEYKEVVNEKPSGGDYFRCNASRRRRWGDGERSDDYIKSITILDLDRYYMNEKLAPQAEEAFQRAIADNKESCHLEIKFLKGVAVPTQLYIDNQRIEDYIKNM